MKAGKRILCLLSVFLLCLTSIWNGETLVCLAHEEGYENENVEPSPSWFTYVNGEIPDITMRKGETVEVNLPITASSTLEVKKIIIDVKEMPFTVKGTPAIYREGNQEPVTKLGTENYFLRFTLVAKKGTEDKTYNIPISFLAGTTADDLAVYSLMDTLPVSYQTVKTVAAGKACISFSSIECDYDDDDKDGAPELNIGEIADVVYSIDNIGSGKAYDITITYDGFGDDAVIPTIKNPTKIISSFDVGEKKTFKIPISPAENCVSGAKKITISISYKETESATEYITEVESFYVQVVGKPVDDTVYFPKLRISEFKQTPAKPEAGGLVKISFCVTNIGTRDAENIIITPINLTNTSFAHLDKDPNVYIKSLKKGASKNITMRYSVSEKVESGLKGIDFSVTFKDYKGKAYSDAFSLYIKNLVAKEEDDSVSVPKIVIQRYSTGVDTVTAGEEFTLALDIKNEHETLSADNIKVTIVTDDTGAFTTAKENNSFYISKILPGDMVHKEIQLKVKADSTTKVYPLTVEFNYEYDGMELPRDTLTSGLIVNEVLNIQVAEDSRPVLTNVLPGTYGELVCGEINSLTFNLANRGKSPLYNVEVTVTGDFQLSREVYFIGTVESGTRTSHELEITPLIEGIGNGLITITYEDSNGVADKIEEEFSAEIVGSIAEEPMEVIEPVEVEKSILPLPVFLVLQVVLFVAGTVITRKVMIRVYRKKKMQEEEKES